MAASIWRKAIDDDVREIATQSRRATILPIIAPTRAPKLRKLRFGGPDKM